METLRFFDSDEIDFCRRWCRDEYLFDDFRLCFFVFTIRESQRTMATYMQ